MILTPEPDRWPVDLFTDPRLPMDAGRAWRVVHTKPRQEKCLARYLRENEIPYYLTVVKKVARYRINAKRRPFMRKLTSHKPLFPGYVFLLGSRQERHEALTTNRIVRTLDVTDQARLWEALRQVKQLLASGKPVMREDNLIPGATVEIKSGPLAGLRGKIVRGTSAHRFVVQVDFIQRGASVTLDDYALKRIEEG
jgi:transcription antitermination factor NusG